MGTMQLGRSITLRVLTLLLLVVCWVSLNHALLSGSTVRKIVKDLKSSKRRYIGENIVEVGTERSINNVIMNVNTFVSIKFRAFCIIV